MRILAHLGVLDEVELIASAIDHLYDIGVDHVVVFDMGSTDGTLEILERYQGAALQLVRLRNDISWDDLRQMTLKSIRQALADWVLFLDADEFWLPVTGSLKECVALAEHDIVIVDRFNVVVTDTGPTIPGNVGPDGYDHTFLYTQHIPDFRKYMEDHPDTPWISGVPLPKVIGRLEFIESITMGGHDIVTDGGNLVRRTRATDVVIAHVPISSLDRFERKAANITKFIDFNANYFVGWQAWHWRRLHDLSRQGRITEEYERQVVDRSHLDALVASGSVRTAAQMLGSPQ